ncbi:hypothetical protein [Actinoplanes sp. DH11]|uniref:hypothetical protein n=1 Tax=Actinoplanes sp. DH11 TaxID=2857011 RepID=UPI001E3862B7|nr:hypothetical protein [Actinoplanes sp. DH11]
MSAVVHQPRVVWDAARSFVGAAAGPHHREFAAEVLHRLGPELYEALLATHEYLVAEGIRTGGDRTATDLEAGKWRVRLDEFLRSRPDSTQDVRDLTSRGFE